MAKNKRRISTNTTLVGAFGNQFTEMDMEDSDVVNLHGFRAQGALEPENTDANCNGYWVVWVIPGGLIQNSDLPTNIGTLGNEDTAPYIWGAGVFVASNQAPHTFEFVPKTSRNLQKGARILLDINMEGVSAGNVRVNSIMTGFTTS